MMKMPLGVSTWCFNDLAPRQVRAVLDGGEQSSPEDLPYVRAYFRELVEVVHNSSIQTLELWYSDVLGDEDVAASINRLSEHGKISSMHAPFGPMRDLGSLDDDVRRRGIEGCKWAANLLNRFGGKTLVIHGGSAAKDAAQKPERIKYSAQSIAEIADFCEGLNIEVAVEMLTNLAVGSSASELLSILRMINRPNVGVCLDVNHVFPADEIIPSVYALGKKIITLHISDYDGKEEKHWLPGMGIIDWRTFIKALHEVGYAGPFMYETRFEAASLCEAASVLEENYKMLMASAGLNIG